MIKSYWYFILTNAETTIFVDNERTIALEKIDINANNKTFEVALLGNDQTVQMIRILVPNLEHEEVTDSDLKIIQSLKEHMLSILRLNYDPTANSTFYVYNFRKTNEFPDLLFTYNTKINDGFSIRNNMIVGSYGNSLNITNQIKLLADSVRKEIPIQYRFLSLYKLLELEFKTSGRWTKEFTDYLKEFETDFKILNLSSRTIENYIHELRDKCAHIKSNRDILGVTELSQADSITMEKFFPLMTKLSAIIINRRYSNENFEIQVN